MDTGTLEKICDALKHNFFETWVEMPATKDESKILLKEQKARYENRIDELEKEMMRKELEWTKKEVEYLKGGNG